MQGCGCIQCAQLGAVGFDLTDVSAFIPGMSDVVAIADIVQQAIQFWDQLQQMLGIGAGRREADVITPVLNGFWNQYCVPASNAVQVSPVNNLATHSCAELQAMLSVLNQAKAKFEYWLRNTQWQDGRAAAKSLYWLLGPAYPIDATLQNEVGQPYGYMVIRDVTRDVNNHCGTGGLLGGITIGSTTIPLPVLAIGGYAAYKLLSKSKK